jgi:SAM-dependent methyltransferase
VKGDLFEFGNFFSNQFDLVTSLHTIPAFLEYRTILTGFVNSLRNGGILIVDLVNKLHSQNAPDLLPLLVDDPDKCPKGMDRDEIRYFFERLDCEVLEIQPHDFWDNYYILNWRHYSSGWFSKRIRKYLWSFLNEAYFAFGLYRVLHDFELDQPDHRFAKYLVAIRKR